MAAHQFALIPTVTVSQGQAKAPWGYDGPTSVVDVVRHWHQQGAARIEIIDTDAVNGGAPNTGPIATAVQSMRLSVHLDLQAGVHDVDSLAQWKQHGPAQLVLSTSAAADPGFISAVIAQEHNGVALELVIGQEDGALFAPGSAAHGRNVFELFPILDQLGLSGYVIRDASHAKHWWQAHRDVIGEVCKATSTPVTAGSGADSLEDLHNLADLVPAGLDGAVIGRALDAGYFTYAEAVAAMQARYDPYEWGPARP